MSPFASPHRWTPSLRLAVVVAVLGAGAATSLSTVLTNVGTPLKNAGTPLKMGTLQSRPHAPQAFVETLPAALPHDARQLGMMAPSRTIPIAFALAPRNPVALAREASAIATPGSASFHHFLTPSVIAQRFGPTSGSIHRVKRALARLGLRVGSLSKNHLMLHATGTVDTMSRALHAHLAAVRLASGAVGWRLVARAVLPRSFGGSVSAVIGLNNVAVAHVSMTPKQVSTTATAARGVSATPSACADATSATRAGGGWTEGQVASAYGLSSLYRAGDLASGQTIAVVELEPFARSDLVTFDRCFFGVSHANLVHRIPVDAFHLIGPGSGESALDIEILSALAPAARINVYEAPNTTIGTLDAYNEIVSADRANIITTSWGECEQLLDAASPGTRQVENVIFEEAAAQGQTFIAATGDSGSDDCATTPFGSSSPVSPYLSVDDPASQPYVLAVGGTSLRSDVQPLSGSNEVAWNGGPQGGATGGGVSSNWASPSWQSHSGVPGVSTTLGRQVPDVSASADAQFGITVYSTSFGQQGWTTIGGTSASAPVWAAVLAEIAASGPTGTACNALTGRAGGPDLGFVPPLLYQAAASSYATTFHAISVGNNDAFRLGLGYRATPGYNLVGGLGSPIVTNPDGSPGLESVLCSDASSVSVGVSQPQAVSLSPNYGPVAGGTSLTIGFAGPLVAGASYAVTIGGVAASVTAVMGSSIVVTVPPSSPVPGTASGNAAGPAAVSITVLQGSQSASSSPSRALMFEYVNTTSSGTVPSVVGVNPSGGNLVGGNPISIYGSGFGNGVPSVTIGGQPAMDVKEVADYLITAVVPPKAASTSCASGVGYSPSTVCQTSVVVTNGGGPSATTPDLPVLTGPLVYTALGAVKAKAGYETAPSATEYDYAPTPSIIAIRPNPASPRANTVIRIIGRGFALNTLYWVNFGPATDVNSEQERILAISNREIDVRAPTAIHLAGRALAGGVSVQSAAGVSKPRRFSYLGIPAVSSVTPNVGQAHRRQWITIRGANLAGVTHVEFVREPSERAVAAVSKHSLRAVSESSFAVRVPSEPAGVYAIEPCNDVWCAPVKLANATYTYVSTLRATTAHARTGP